MKSGKAGDRERAAGPGHGAPLYSSRLRMQPGAPDGLFPMTAGQVPVHGIGLVAAQALASGPALRVAGTTSRGVFLRTVGRWIVFLSFETPLSPLTVALGPGGAVLKAVAPGEPVLSGREDRFPRSQAPPLLLRSVALAASSAFACQHGPLPAGSSLEGTGGRGLSGPSGRRQTHVAGTSPTPGRTNVERGRWA